jgi:hypothetical protein
MKLFLASASLESVIHAALAIRGAIKTWARRNFKEQSSVKAQFFS